MAGIILFFAGGMLGWFITRNQLLDKEIITPTTNLPKRPLLTFTFDNLFQRGYPASPIEIGEKLNNNTEDYTARLFSFQSDGKKVTGQINLPQTEQSQKMPVIIMLRGYVDQAIYRTGIGTEKAAAVFAQNGYITLAPDFLGYGGSDDPKNNVWWERFNRPVTVLNLLTSVENLPQADSDQVGLWAHSNGGQIALSVLAITREEIPTTLWAPVTKPFPYSVLYYTDEYDDEGQTLRAKLCQLEKNYDIKKFSVTNYLERINAPLQIHQGTADEAVPTNWSNEFVEKLTKLDITHDYFQYPGADHNMVGSWNEVVNRDLAFFTKNL